MAKVKYTEEIKNQMRELYSQGLTYAEIGKKYGVCKQRIFQLIGSRCAGKFRYVQEKDCVWVGVRRWMNQNRISRLELCRLYYGNTLGENYKRLNGRLQNSPKYQIYKDFIDKILDITGLTYEEAFEEVEKI